MTEDAAPPPTPPPVAQPMFRYTVCTIGGHNITCESPYDWMTFIEKARSLGFIVGTSVYQPMDAVVAIYRVDAPPGGAVAMGPPGMNVIQFPNRPVA